MRRYKPRRGDRQDPRDLDALDIQDVTNDLVDEAEELGARATALGRLPVVAFLRAALNAGAGIPTSSWGARITSVGPTVTISLDPRLRDTAIAHAQDQADEPLLYSVRSQTPNTIEIAAYALGGAQTDLSVGSHAFSLLVHADIGEE